MKREEGKVKREKRRVKREEGRRKIFACVGEENVVYCISGGGVKKRAAKEYMYMTEIRITLRDGRRMDAELFEEQAPISAANFVKLASAGFYDGLCFHRVIDEFMIQGGGFRSEAGGLAAKGGCATIRGEFSENGIPNPVKHTVGTLSMARTNVPDSASSQFFICVADTPFLDGKYAAFGRLVDQASIDVAVAIGKVKTHRVGYFDDVPVEPVVIKSIRVIQK